MNCPFWQENKKDAYYLNGEGLLNSEAGIWRHDAPDSLKAGVREQKVIEKLTEYCNLL